MKKYKDITKKIVTKSECIELKCDLCGKIAEHPQQEIFEWGSTGVAKGQLKWHYAIDGEYEPEECDLCYECAHNLGTIIQNYHNNYIEYKFDVTKIRKHLLSLFYPEK